MSYTLQSAEGSAISRCCRCLGYCRCRRGSTGFGQDSLATLPGNIGDQDVRDCMAALKQARTSDREKGRDGLIRAICLPVCLGFQHTSAYSILLSRCSPATHFASSRQAVDAGIADPKRAAVVGGSHGGFLTGHLLGQHPDAFRLGVLRNPGEDRERERERDRERGRQRGLSFLAHEACPSAPPSSMAERRSRVPPRRHPFPHNSRTSLPSVCNLSLMVGVSDIADW